MALGEGEFPSRGLLPEAVKPGLLFVGEPALHPSGVVVTVFSSLGFSVSPKLFGGGRRRQLEK